MANIKSAKKRILVNDKKRDQNKIIASEIKTDIKKFKELAQTYIKEKKRSLEKAHDQKSETPVQERNIPEQSEQPEIPMEIFKPVNMVLSADERKRTSEHIWGLKAIDEIKRRRSVLTREMARAKRAGDETKIAEIQAERQKLTAKRKAACLRISGPEMAKIKEERRQLTKRMTIARRQKDQATMEQVTAERLILKEQVKVINSYIRAFDYRKHRKAFIKPSTLWLIYSHQREYARAA